MKRIFFFFLIGILTYPIADTLGQNGEKVENALPQGTNKVGYYESIFYPHRQLNQMPKEKEKVLLKFHTVTVKNKLEELKRLSTEKYYEMLWDLPIPLPKNVDKHDDRYLNDVVIYRGPELPERTNSNVLQIDMEILALKYKNAENPLKQNLRNKLRDELFEYFQMRVSQIQERVKDAENKLNDLTLKVKLVNTNKEQIVNKRLEDLLK